uniref:Tyrosine--tRNA ligase n=1 Tax=Parastrongyloides trichosuri TaxID=131310 RepID=A0A0N4ZZ26_PARTI
MKLKYIQNTRYFSQQIKKTPLLNFCHDLNKRNLIYASHPLNILQNDGILLKNLPSTLYGGFDPTANSLHVGHLFILNALLRSSKLFQCKPIALIGDATGLIGDPSGRNMERPQLSKEIVAQNSIDIKDQIKKIYTNVQLQSEVSLEIISNMEWYKNMSMLDYLRLSKKFRVGEMMRLGAVKARLDDDSGISFTEFAYQTLQSYDFFMLSELKNCFFQIGGSDQLGHINSGYNYIKRCNNKISGGICMPLLTDGSGNKIGKSNGGNGLWLSKARTSPYAFYQYFKQLHDDVAEKMLMSLSLKSLSEILEIIDIHRNNLGKWIVQEQLAEEMTLIVHGYQGLEIAKKCSNIIFRGSLDEADDLDEDTLIQLFGTSSFKINKNDISTYGDLAKATRKDKIKGDVLMTKNSFKINGVLYNNPETKIDFSKILLRSKNCSIISWGKRKFFLVIWK